MGIYFRTKRSDCIPVCGEGSLATATQPNYQTHPSLQLQPTLNSWPSGQWPTFARQLQARTPRNPTSTIKKKKKRKEKGRRNPSPPAGPPQPDLSRSLRSPLRHLTAGSLPKSSRRTPPPPPPPPRHALRRLIHVSAPRRRCRLEAPLLVHHHIPVPDLLPCDAAYEEGQAPRRLLLLRGDR